MECFDLDHYSLRIEYTTDSSGNNTQEYQVWLHGKSSAESIQLKFKDKATGNIDFSNSPPKAEFDINQLDGFLTQLDTMATKTGARILADSNANSLSIVSARDIKVQPSSS